MSPAPLFLHALVLLLCIDPSQMVVQQQCHRAAIPTLYRVPGREWALHRFALLAKFRSARQSMWHNVINQYDTVVCGRPS
jgi:hypothetical protein